MSQQCRHMSNAAAATPGLPGFRRLPWFIMAALGTTPAWAAPAASGAAAPSSVEFNNAFTGAGQSAVDVSRFEKGNPVLPGTYRVDVYLNEVRMDREDIVFRPIEGSDTALPCLSYNMLSSMGVDMSKLTPGVATPDNVCITIGDISPDASVNMDVGALRLDLSIPQDSLLKQARGYVNPALWDQGETAFIAGYNLNVYSTNQTIKGAGSPYGTAVDASGSPVTITDGTHYSLAAGGGYTPNPNGNFMLQPNGTYVPVRPGSYLAPHSGNSHYNDVNAFLGLNLGLNVAGWRIRSYETAQWDQKQGRTMWKNINTTASHDIPSWKAQVTIGDGYTQGTLFDSSPYRGVTLYSDDRMLPDSQQGYAPVVHGVANTQARVEVRQNGNLLYETTVAPGPFTINDLYATGYGGDLIVTVFEADGSTHTIAVPYAAVPQLLRPGISRWAITNGQFHDTSLSHRAPFYVEGTYQRGINNYLTVYGGLQTTYRALYKSYMGGVAVNTPVGAVAADVTNSHTNFKGASDNSLSGYSARLSYSKVLPTEGTTFALATYRYSNSNFLSLADAVQRQDIGASIGTSAGLMNLPRPKQRMQLTLNQNLGNEYGSLYFSGSRYDYWNDSNSATTYMLGYSNNFKRVNFGVTASRSVSSGAVYRGSRFDNQFGLNLSLPLGTDIRAPHITFNATHDDVTGNSDRVAVNGNFGRHDQFNYNAGVNYNQNSYSAAGGTTSYNGNIGWTAPYGTINAGYSGSSRYQQASASASGGVVVHQGGVTLSPTLDLTSPIGIIEAPGAKGARVTSGGSGKVDGRGYAIATGLIPYRMNDVRLDPAGSSLDVELQTTRVQTAPRAGAVVPLKFDTVTGRAVLIRVTRSNGEVLPFGALVTNEAGEDLGIVGQGGQIFVRGAEEGGTLVARWGDDADQQCRLQYNMPSRGSNWATAEPLSSMEATCH